MHKFFSLPNFLVVKDMDLFYIVLSAKLVISVT